MMLEYSNKENEMKKILILLLSIVIVFTSCATAKVEAVPEIVAPQPVSVPDVQEEGISGEIIEVSKYGNTYIDVTTDALLEEFALGDIVEISVNGNTIVAPVVTSYSDVDNGSPLVKVDGENVEVALSYADFAGTYGAGVGTGMTITLFEKEGYLAEYQVRHLERTDVREDYESDEVFANFRALSGGNLKLLDIRKMTVITDMIVHIASRIMSEETAPLIKKFDLPIIEVKPMNQKGLLA